jgi:Tfp pilus assembly protein PilN
MRPVNLIPVENRQGQHSPLRSGPLAYIVIGALVALLAGVTAIVLTGNQIAEQKDEVVQLKREDTAETARAHRLSSYSKFASLQEQRVATVTSLADSRFDWERVMRELSLVLPSNVWLVTLNATATSGTSIDGGSGGGSSSGAGLRGAVPGPALELSGCASGQEAVASFVTVLKDIDGVTRVGVQSSELSEQESTGAASSSEGGGGGGDEDCRTRDFIAKFDLVVAFDAAPVPVTGTTEAEAPVAPPAEAEATPTSSEAPEGE